MNLYQAGILVALMNFFGSLGAQESISVKYFK